MHVHAHVFDSIGIGPPIDGIYVYMYRNTYKIYGELYTYMYVYIYICV